MTKQTLTNQCNEPHPPSKRPNHRISFPIDTLILILAHLSWERIYELSMVDACMESVFAESFAFGSFFYAREKRYYLNWVRRANGEDVPEESFPRLPIDVGFPRAYLDVLLLHEMDHTSLPHPVHLSKESKERFLQWRASVLSHLRHWITSETLAPLQPHLPYSKFCPYFEVHCHPDLYTSAILFHQPRMRMDREIVDFVVGKHGQNIMYSHKFLDRQLYLTAVTAGYPLLLVPKKYRGDDEFIVPAVCRAIGNFASVPKKRRADKRLLLMCHKAGKFHDWNLLEHVPDELLSKQLYLEIAEEHHYTNILHWAPEECWSDRDFVVKAVELGIMCQSTLGKYEETPLRYCSERFRDDFEIVMKAVTSRSKHSEHWLYLSYESLDMYRNGGYLSFASERLRSNKEIVLAAVNCDYRALQHASEELQNDPECLAAQEESKKHFRGEIVEDDESDDAQCMYGDG